MKSKPDDVRVTLFLDYLPDVYISEEVQYSPEYGVKHQQSQLKLMHESYFILTLILIFVQLIQKLSCL